MPDERLEELVTAVCARPVYAHISPDLVRWVGAQELSKRRNLKEAVRHTRARLHQVGGAYLEAPPDYHRWQEQLVGLPHTLDAPAVREFCRDAMRQHASTRERLPILDEFFTQALNEIAPVRSVLDIGCGLNPLALPWVPTDGAVEYLGLDIFADMAAFLNSFLSQVGVQGGVQVYNLVNGLPQDLPNVQVALLLKTLQCLEQLEKKITGRLLDGLRAEYLLVSYPVHSLGGRSKGMRATYEAHFDALTRDRGWRPRRFEFKTELAFLVKLESQETSPV